ncbi:MAG: LamG domain-containing protein [Magnetococcales bacterium]|nr:LamG domain-containing protein [Magnetococcales bacterium]
MLGLTNLVGFGPATSPNKNIKLLCHCDSAGTSFVDSSLFGNTITAQGNATQSTTQSKFGGSSAYLDGTSDNLSTANVADFAFGTGDFTLACWVYYDAASVGSDRGIFDGRTTPTGNLPTVYTGTSGVLYYYTGSSNKITSAAGVMLPRTWQHIALARSGSSTRLFVNGVQVGSTYTDTTNYAQTRFFVGRLHDQTNGWLGYIDEILIMKGQALYTSTFPPPAAPYEV